MCVCVFVFFCVFCCRVLLFACLLVTVVCSFVRCFEHKVCCKVLKTGFLYPKLQCPRVASTRQSPYLGEDPLKTGACPWGGTHP